MSTEELKALTERIEKLEAVDVGKKKRKTKDPNAPKKAPSAYNKYVKEQTALIKKETPDMKFGDVSKEIAKRWADKKKESAK